VPPVLGLMAMAAATSTVQKPGPDAPVFATFGAVLIPTEGVALTTQTDTSPNDGRVLTWRSQRRHLCATLLVYCTKGGPLQSAPPERSVELRLCDLVLMSAIPASRFRALPSVEVS